MNFRNQLKGKRYTYKHLECCLTNILQEEKLAYEIQLKTSSSQLEEIRSQLQMKDGEVIKLKKDNKVLVEKIQMHKVKFTITT